MLALAADWRPGTAVRTGAAARADPALGRYVLGWPGARDRGVVAETAGGTGIGAAWWRLLPADRPGYGFVSAEVPELSVGVLPEHRGRGIGTALLGALLATAVDDGVAGLSLSVERDNPAASLYGRLGFVEVESGGGAATMLLRL